MNPQNITPRQKELLSIIYEYIRSTGYPPAFEEMRGGLNVSSNQGIIDLLKKLEANGFITRKGGVSRGIKVLPKAYRLLGASPLYP